MCSLYSCEKACLLKMLHKPLGDDLNPSLVKIQSNVSNLSISSFEADPTGSSIS
jgi:hypothetical protein